MKDKTKDILVNVISTLLIYGLVFSILKIASFFLGIDNALLVALSIAIVTINNKQWKP